MKSLPNKPSDLLLLALADLELVEADPNYVVSMGWYHKPDGDVCHVCLAGAVLAKTYKIPPDIDYKISSTPAGSTSAHLAAINALRVGNLGAAFDYLGLNLPLGLPSVITTELASLSNNNRAEWLPHMADLVGILQAEGF